MGYIVTRNRATGAASVAQVFMAMDIMMLDQGIMVFAVMQLKFIRSQHGIYVVHQALAPDMRDTL